MPTVAQFFGIIIRMYYNDHPPPHFHAIYQGREALVRIGDGAIIAGSLPRTARGIVSGWAAERQDELMANWERARAFAPLERIAGPDQD